MKFVFSGYAVAVLIFSLLSSTVCLANTDLRVRVEELVIFPQTHNINTTFSIVDKTQYPPGTIVSRSAKQSRRLSIELLDCESIEARNCSSLPLLAGKFESYDYAERSYFPTQEVAVSLADNHYLFVLLKDSSSETEEKFFVSTAASLGNRMNFRHHGWREPKSLVEKISEQWDDKRISHGDISLTLSLR